MMRNILLASVIALCTHSAFAIDIAKDGKVACVIVTADDPSQTDQNAAKDLAEHLSAVTGGTFDIKVESNVAAEAPQILVGPSNRAQEILGNVDWDGLGADGIVIRTIGPRLVLSGAPGAPRGTLYAVYTFLEDHVGCRWWTSTESQIPRRPTLSIDRINITYTPKLVYREAYYRDNASNPTHAVRLKLNGQHNNIPVEWGGHRTLIGWCHTFFSLIPPGEHFASHPEWFSEIDGHRTTAGQLCLSNEAMRAQLTKKVFDWIEANPAAGIVSVSQNDNVGACQCRNCRAIEAQEGSSSGPLIRFVNAIAADVKKQHPGFLVETLAYQYTRKPLKLTKPADNVLVRLCSIEANFAHPLSGESNKAFGNDLRGWAAISPKLFVWNYVTNFVGYLQPHPNIGPLDDDLRFFVDHNVVGVFEQGDFYNTAGDFVQLRAWLLAKLMWDPSRDVKQLQCEFLEGYYGPAAPQLEQYLELVAAPVKDPTFRLPCGHADANYISAESLGKAVALFDEAAKSVAGDETLTMRVRRERLAIDLLQLQRWDFAKRFAAFKSQGHSDDAAHAAMSREYRTAADSYVADARRLGAVNYSEMMGFDGYTPSLRMAPDRFRPPTIPSAGASLPAGAFDIQEDRFHLHQRGTLADVVDDPIASNGKAAKTAGGHGHWAIQYHVDEKSQPAGPGPWKCYLLVRVERKDKSAGGAAFHFGVHDARRNVFIAHQTVALSDAGDGTAYQPHGVLVDELRDGMYFWVAPLGNAAVDVYVDRIFVQRDDAAASR